MHDAKLRGDCAATRICAQNKRIAQAQLECLEQSLRFLVSQVFSSSIGSRATLVSELGLTWYDVQWGPKKVAAFLSESLLPHLANYQDVEAEVPDEEGKPPLDAEDTVHNILVRFEVCAHSHTLSACQLSNGSSSSCGVGHHAAPRQVEAIQGGRSVQGHHRAPL
jgi:hypothetical protein